jgi:polysaccharide pyruvyl transferase CsaB
MPAAHIPVAEAACPRYVLAGAIGRGNFGDEAMLLAALGRYGKTGVEVLSKTPAETARVYEVAAIGRLNFVKLFRAFARGAALVFVGGSLLQDVSSRRSLLYYVSLVALARLLRAPVIFEGQGFGPFRSPWAEGLAKFCLAAAVKVELRDPVAFKQLKQLGPNVTLGIDPVFRLPLKVAPYKTLPRSVAFVIRPHATLTDERKQALLRFCQSLGQRWGKRLVFIPLALPEDLALSQWFCERLSGLPAPCQLFVAKDLTQLLGALKQMQLVMSMRYHGCAFAEWLQVDYVGLAYDPKVERHCALFKRPWLSLHDLNLDSLNYLWSHFQAQ